VIIPVRAVLMAGLLVSIVFMWMIMPMRAMLMIILFVGIFLMGMIMPMCLIVLMRMVSMRIIVIGHVFTSDGRLSVHCSTAKTTLGAFDQHLASVDSIYY